MPKLCAVVVEDDMNLGASFTTVLELSGFDVVYVNDSTAALDKIVEVKPALVMLDLQMPKVSGLDILQSIRQNEHVAKTKVIILTANSYALRDETLNELADLILLKPASVSQIQSFATRLTRTDG